MNVPFKRLDVGTMTTGATLSGLSFGWGSGHVSEVFQMMAHTSITNPLLMSDETDKIGGHQQVPIESVLLSLLEPENGQSFKDEAILLAIDCSKTNFIARANDINRLSEPLRSRFTIVEIQAPSRQESLAVIEDIYHKILSINSWDIDSIES